MHKINECMEFDHPLFLTPRVYVEMNVVTAHKLMKQALLNSDLKILIRDWERELPNRVPPYCPPQIHNSC
jgi:hypothetical protein